MISAMRSVPLRCSLLVLLLGALMTGGQAGARSSWTQVGLGEQLIKHLVVDPTVPGRVYALGVRPTRFTPGNTLFRSDDDGANWVAASRQEVGGPSTGGIAIDDHGGIYVPDLGVIYFSRDGGATWVQTTGIRGDHGIAIIPGDPPILYVSGSGQFSRSQDGGETWVSTEPLVRPRCTPRTLAVSPATPQVVYIARDCGVVKSEDRGETWVDVLEVPASVVLVHPINPESIYVGGPSTLVGDPHGLWRSDDAGTTWVRLATDRPIRQLIFDPRDPTHRVLVAESEGAFIWSADEGVSWTELGAPPLSTSLPSPSIKQSLIAVGDRVLIGWAGGAWETTLPPFP
jgi:hypothetical protein